ncbi:DUF3110 domain-containing protein [Pleurocapsales cyanobacterium LEGE 06147]|nr:DUF3110 domain-containing protein [Pleurocapsales cyanobacterium LEGE 06147]
MRVYILLFNAGTDSEGIHTVQIGDRNKVLMFEEEDDAARYAMMLEAQDFPKATVEAIASEEVEDFCREAGYDWEIVEGGKLAIPPEENVEKTDWNLEGEPSTTSAAATDESEMSTEELDRIRRKLEGLL